MSADRRRARLAAALWLLLAFLVWHDCFDHRHPHSPPAATWPPSTSTSSGARLSADQRRHAPGRVGGRPRCDPMERARRGDRAVGGCVGRAPDGVTVSSWLQAPGYGADTAGSRLKAPGGRPLPGPTAPSESDRNPSARPGSAKSLSSLRRSHDAPPRPRLEPRRAGRARRSGRSCSMTRRCATGCSPRRCARRPSTRSCASCTSSTDLGIECADIGLPGAGPRVAEDVERLVREIVEREAARSGPTAPRARSSPTSARSSRSRSARACSSRCAAFIGSSPLRQYAEGGRSTSSSAARRRRSSFAIKEGLTVFFVTEDTLRADPGVAARCSTRRRCGPARRGSAWPTRSATPRPTARARWCASRCACSTSSARTTSASTGTGTTTAAWRWSTAIAALRGGRHASAWHGLGVGERTGNTPMDLLLVNLALLGYSAGRPAAKLPAYCEAVSRGDRRADPGEIPGGRDGMHSGRRPACTPRPSRRRPGKAIARPSTPSTRACLPSLVGPRAADRGRAAVGQVERDLLAREARADGVRRPRRPHPRPRQTVADDAHGGGDFRGGAARRGTGETHAAGELHCIGDQLRARIRPRACD